MHDNTSAAKRPLVLVIDDTPQNLALMRDVLESHYTVKLAPSGARPGNCRRYVARFDSVGHHDA